MSETKQVVIRVGQIWRRKRTGALVRVTRLKNEVHGSGAPYYDVSWETYGPARIRRGSCFQDYWLRDNELVEEAPGAVRGGGSASGAREGGKA